ncbi:MAG: penicillin-binding protein 1C [Planctomycetes bacterium]|nr:penicillin-binding protein 1C [Planctomycetota bacterium]
MALRHRLVRFVKRAAIAAACFTVLAAATLATLSYIYEFPKERLSDWPQSPVLTDRHDRLIMRRVGQDQHWRMPVKLGEISPWLAKATIAVEDKRFYEHWGVDGLAACRAAWQNASNLKVVSGASTITMQVCRIIDPRPRTFWAKSVQAFRAIQLEQICGKDEILEYYLNIAPYGRNIRGAQAAAMIYFGKHASDLSLGESALLAGLPQSPNRFRPDRDAASAINRRQTVLARMLDLGMIDQGQYNLACSEPLARPTGPNKPLAWHAAAMAFSERPGGGRCTLDLEIQAGLERSLAGQMPALPAGSDVAAVVIDIETGDILALAGSAGADDPDGGMVNGATAWRSPGSALKPFVYAAAFESGRLAPDSTVYDMPIIRAEWQPRNFDKQFRGSLTAAEALRESLNVPAILVAEQTGLEKCVGLMEACGVRFNRDPRTRSGLAAVVGASEVRLIDLVNAYATIGRGGYLLPVRLFADRPAKPVMVVSADACRTLDWILSSRARRPMGMENLSPDQVPWFAWKTGTSSGRRDAWAVGHNGRFAVGVWVGRFEGSGDWQFVGNGAAEPILAAIFSLPELPCRADPPDPPKLLVTNPLGPPVELSGTLGILWPTDGASFRAVGAAAAIHPLTNSTRPLMWFLNGSPLDCESAKRLLLAPGDYQLRCVDDLGNAAAVNFSVR